MQEKLKALAEAARRDITVAGEPARVEELRVRFLGKKGELSQVLGSMGKLPPEERRSLGEVANRVKAEIESLLAAALER
ncbi:MAG: phenylalanine--tRNA ligase subunit alpha, partial [Myxococcaceae bacterium]|nr:phenylalanine--tRNA ligase subunit alpha [Myxococcaceae bacterium]